VSATTSSTPGRYGGALRGRRLPAVEERSAGGVVIDVHEGSARTAVIARRNRAGRVEWCLPKGHIEPGETLPQTAEREVAEETGSPVGCSPSSGPSTTGSPPPTVACTSSCTTTFLEALGGELTIDNDPDREAIDVAWFPLQEVHHHLTFPNERRIAQAAWERLAGTA
jgi:8-oxo-dGTP pyrophosphatase MutT (NUDIX family)